MGRRLFPLQDLVASTSGVSFSSIPVLDGAAEDLLPTSVIVMETLLDSTLLRTPLFRRSDTSGADSLGSAASPIPPEIESSREMIFSAPFSSASLTVGGVPSILIHPDPRARPNAAENSSAVMMAAKNKMDIALQISIGSATQIVMFVAPLLVLVSLFFKGPMNLVFNTFELVAIIMAVFISNFVTADGHSNWLEGIQLLMAYAIMAVAFFFLP
jgi:hypothetical protein